MRRTPLFFLLIFCLGIGIGAVMVKKQSPIRVTQETAQSVSTDQAYPLLAKRLFRIPEQELIVNFTPLRVDLNAYIATQSGSISTYFEYIPTGNSIGVNGAQTFAYASLLKVPMVMAFYRIVDQGQIKKTDTLTITSDVIDKSFGTLWQKGPGTKLSVADAIRFTLTDSDNTAYQLLRKQVSPKEFANIFENLDIPLDIQNNEPTVTAKNYISILKSLFFTSSLRSDDSQEILRYLSQSSYTTGIRKPIPTTIAVAHKMGIITEQEALYDCGIVYLPNNPYFLCVMTANRPQEEAERIIQTISGKVYDFLK